MNKGNKRRNKQWLPAVAFMFLLIMGFAVSVSASETKRLQVTEIIPDLQEQPESPEPEKDLSKDDEFIACHYVMFYDGSDELAELAKNIQDGGEIIFPELPDKEYYRGIGWSFNENAVRAEYKPGDILKTADIPEGKEPVFYAVYERTGCAVTFEDDETGLETDLVEKGVLYTMPAPSGKDGLRSMGWSTDPNARSAEYRAGKSYVITEDLTLYPVRQRLYTITFLTNTGKTTKRLKALTVTGVWKEKIVLPDLPQYSGYTSLGWAAKANSQSVGYLEGSTYTIEGNRKLYQVNRRHYTVSFCSSNGSTAGFTGLTKTIMAKDYLTMPELPAKSGYDSVGWSLTKGAAAAKYKPGAKVKVTKSAKFYAVYQKTKYNTLQFYTANGGYEYSELRIRVKQGSWQKLPRLPRRLNYQAVGWGTDKVPKESEVKTAGSSVRVTQNMKFYGCWKTAKTVQFYLRDGSKEYMSLRVDVTGGSIILPTAFSPKGYTFLGWSAKPNQTSYPQYQMGRRLTVSKSMKLYAVCMKKPMKTVEAKDLKVSQKYDQVFFIGDSRTYELKRRLEDQLGKGTAEERLKLKIFAKGKMGIEWFQENKDEFISSIKAQKGKKAVVFNFGVNDLRYNYDSLEASIDTYVSEMGAFARALKSSGCDMYFMSVNPLNEKELSSENYGNVSWKRTPEWVQNFNYSVRTQLSDYTYIDMYNYLINTGFEMRDGLHYSAATYDKIYNKMISVIDR